jgi:3'(2'),5'-bisphosphate nucleotidase
MSTPDRFAEDLDRARLLELLAPAMREAGALIEGLKASGLEARDKADKSPVTEADEAAEALLESAIRAAEPDAVIVGEEASAAGIQPGSCARFWLIDPLDGTRDFVEGGADYSVNIGLIEEGVPVIGLVLHPPSGTLWTGARNLGAWKQSAAGTRDAIRTRALANPPSVVTSRSHLDARTKAWVAAIPGAAIRPSGSSLKLCLVAEGAADIYPRFGQTSEWDTAAADAVLRAAGGVMLGTDGQAFHYGKPDYRNTSFLALGDPAARTRLPPFRD